MELALVYIRLLIVMFVLLPAVVFVAVLLERAGMSNEGAQFFAFIIGAPLMIAGSWWATRVA